MASASSSTSIPPQPPRSYSHHVFLSFRGEDTRNGFTSHLYAALNRKGITTYKDDKNLRKGDLISEELVKAIEQSMFAVIVFSPDYASSSWCLDELCKIIECKNKLGLKMVEVFYGVEPCDVRHQIGAFQKAFEKQEGIHDSEKIQRWRDALAQVSDYSGWTSKNQDEATLVENIAQDIFEKVIPKMPSSMKNLVGIKSRVKGVISQIGLGLNDVRYICIWGMGGIGKTTIARALFETIRSGFEVTCFLADVREQFEKKDITHIQKQLLDQINISSDGVYNKYDGRTIIQNSLRLKKVLLVLDDVNDEKQLENLAGEQDWFGFGSRIIITTRDVEVLKEQEVHITYKVEGLVESEASNLFCSKAFKRKKPSEEFLDLSKKVVNYSGGLPLALKVLGSYLNGRSIAVWYSAIEKIKKFSHAEIIDVLKISYDGLDSMEKNIFLDIACFLKGHRKDYVTKILEGCGHDAEIGIDILINRSLVTLEENFFGGVIVGMHDLLEDMGKHIVKQESPNDPSKRSRLWSYKDVDYVLTQNKEIEATHSIALDNMYKEIEGNWRDLNMKDLSFSNVCRLKLLILDGVKATIVCNIPCTLKVLHWRHCPMKTLPFTNQCYELVEIDLSDSKIVQLWDGKKFLDKLEHLNLSSCHELKQTPDLSGAPNLKTLHLELCGKLNYIHPSLAYHKSLVALNLSGCRSLETLGDKLEMSSLKKLDLSFCESLRRLPEFDECMKQLSILTLSRICNINVPKTIVNLVGLSEVDFGDCEFPDVSLSLGCFVGLKKLEFSGCSELSCILYSSHGLESLTVWGWPDRQSIARFLRPLSHLIYLSSLKLHRVFEEPTFYYDLGHLPLLTDLDLSDNEFLRVPISIHQLPRLTRLKLNHCYKMKVLPELPSSLRELHAHGCRSLHTSSVNDVISKACCVFAESATQDGEDVLQMVIRGKKIPAWFDIWEHGDTVSISFQHNGHSTETIALALCFVITDNSYENKTSLICNGKIIMNKRLLMSCTFSKNLFIVCLNSYYFSKLLCEHNHFQMLSPSNKVHRSGARWVCMKDIQVFKKIKSQTAKEE